jgi:hypothetical protein
MAHITSLGAGMFSDLAFSIDSEGLVLPASPDTVTNWAAQFATEVAVGTAPSATVGEFYRIKNVREFPALGTPPNIVNVPVYGQKTSSQIQGQADAPTLEIQLNLIAADWQKAANYLGNFVGNGKTYYFRFALLNTDSTGSTAATKYASVAGGLGTVDNSQWYWLGKIEAFVVQPQLTDANTATLTLSAQSDFYGAFTTSA